jgi:hypothetical protein
MVRPLIVSPMLRHLALVLEHLHTSQVEADDGFQQWEWELWERFWDRSFRRGKADSMK